MQVVLHRRQLSVMLDGNSLEASRADLEVVGSQFWERRAVNSIG